jgi:hypothetical protein
MKLLKNYSLKKSKSAEIICFTFPIIDNRNRKTTPRLGKSDDSPTRRVGESLREKDSIEIVFSHTKVGFSPPKFEKKDDFLPKNIR